MARCTDRPRGRAVVDVVPGEGDGPARAVIRIFRDGGDDAVTEGKFQDQTRFPEEKFHRAAVDRGILRGNGR